MTHIDPRAYPGSFCKRLGISKRDARFGFKIHNMMSKHFDIRLVIPTPIETIINPASRIPGTLSFDSKGCLVFGYSGQCSCLFGAVAFETYCRVSEKVCYTAEMMIVLLEKDTIVAGYEITIGE